MPVACIRIHKGIHIVPESKELKTLKQDLFRQLSPKAHNRVMLRCARLDFKEKHNVPIFCGEFGCVVHGSPETRQNWTNDIIALFKKHKISYTYWNYKNLDFGIYDYTEVYASNKNYSEKERLDEGVLKALQSGIL